MTERSVFLAALDIDDPAARSAYLGMACAADPGLRRRVEELLAAHAASGTFLVQPAAENALLDVTAESPRAEPVPLESGLLLDGRYRLLGPIGEGGMGTVYRADQLQPVKRTVAVKLIKPGMDSKAVLARFEAERQALALMDHPHIAKVFDAGVAPDGRPFFVMELVEGVSLTEYCDARRMSVTDRLTLFGQVCGAVQHAHQKGVIHRDLKPSNVLVAERDNKPMPKVIDFGLAKAVGGTSLTEHALLTGYGTILGTPLYMAPEQATFQAADVDTRTDVYALGVILYELLTGTTPITRVTLRAAAMEEMLKLIREQDPPTPSSRLSTADGRPGVAANRQSEPAQLERLVRGELDWIVMKALAKDRERRYETAGGFATDVACFLNHEPVQAGPTTAAYRARKFVRRNRAAVTATGLIVLALVAGVVGTGWGMVRAAVQRDKAVEATERAERATGRTFQALDTLTEDALEGLLGRQNAWGDRERLFLVKVRDQFAQLAETEGETPAVRRLRAAVQLRLGSVQALLGDAAAAEADYRVAAAEFDRLAEPPDRANAAISRRRLAGSLALGGRSAEAEIEYRRAGEAFDRLSAEFPADADYRFQSALIQNAIGFVRYKAGDFTEAETQCRASAHLQRELAAANPNDPRYPAEQARALHNLFSVLRRTNRAAEAERTIDDCVALLRTAVASHRDPEFSVALGKALMSRTAILVDRRELAHASSVQREAVSLHAALAADHPVVPDYRHELAKAQFNLGVLFMQMDRTDDAIAAYRDALVTNQRLADDFPKVTDYRQYLALNRQYLGGVLIDPSRGLTGGAALTEASLAHEVLIAAVPVWEKLHADAPASPTNLVGLVWTLVNLAKAADIRKDYQQARAYLERAERYRTTAPGMMAKDPNGPGAVRILALFLARTLVNLGDHAAGAVRADELARIEKPEGADNAFNAGCYMARCAGLAAKDPALPADRQKARADEYAVRAVAHLKTAATRGFENKKAFREDADLTPLRDRDDYKQLLRELETKVPSK